MADPPSKPTPPSKPIPNANTNTTKSKSTAPSRPYISGGQMLASPPLTARLSSLVDHTYNFFGLYVVSLFSLDPYVAAQNSSFNTAGPGRVSNAARARWGGGTGTTGTTGSRGGGGGGGGGGGNGGSGRRLGTVDDVRGPECGSCG